MTTDEYIALVASLNKECGGQTSHLGMTIYPFEVRHDGEVVVITFFGKPLWCSDADEGLDTEAGWEEFYRELRGWIEAVSALNLENLTAVIEPPGDR